MFKLANKTVMSQPEEKTAKPSKVQRVKFGERQRSRGRHSLCSEVVIYHISSPARRC